MIKGVCLVAIGSGMIGSKVWKESLYPWFFVVVSLYKQGNSGHQERSKDDVQ